MNLLYALVTIALFLFCRQLLSPWKSPLANPLLASIAISIATLLLLELPYQDYADGTAPLVWLLEPAVVALAIPLYNQLHSIREQLKPILLSCLLGVVISSLITLGIAVAMGADRALVLSLLPKSVTSPIAMAIAQTNGGHPALAAAVVIGVGLAGALGGFSLLRRCGIEDPQAQGLAIGCGAHAIGTAKALEEGATQGSYSSLALVICGILTALLAPLLVWLLDWLIFY